MYPWERKPWTTISSPAQACLEKEVKRRIHGRKNDKRKDVINLFM
jgi:hypothetical protein